MAAARAYKVDILCHLSQKQIEHAVQHVAKQLPNDLYDLCDIDELMYNDTVRVCVDFNIDALGSLIIEAAEILDIDWNLLESDSFAFRQRLDEIIDDYNKQNQQSFKRAIEIHKDQLEYMHY